MNKKEIDWGNLGFGYYPTANRYISYYTNGSWDDGLLTDDSDIILNEAAVVLHYAQTCFEGLKAYATQDGKFVLFRPDQNAKRMAATCHRLLMPEFPSERFIDAIKKVVNANIEYIPPYGLGAALYIRPYMFGSGAKMGVGSSDEFIFRIFCSPVGPYFKAGFKPARLKVSEYDRAAPNGTGHIKAGLNYAMSLFPGYKAKKAGYAENLYLDAATHTKVEETGGTNIIFVTTDNKIITPKSSSILPSITRQSLMQIATDYLGFETEEREISIDEVSTFAECGVCGTAAVITPVGRIDYGNNQICFPTGMEKAGPVIKKLYETLTGIQVGRINGPKEWVIPV